MATETATVHVVDDDEAVREVAQLLLERSGHRVRTVAGAEQALAALRDYRDRLAAMADDFDTAQESETGVLSHDIDIFKRSMAFLDRALADGRIAEADLAAYCRANTEDFHECFFAATKAQLDACHADMMHLKERVLTAEDWASLRLVVMGAHMAHKRNNHLQ